MHPEDEVIVEEYKESQKEAEEIANRPLELIQPQNILTRCLAYSGQDALFYELITEKDDEEQLKELTTLAFYSSYILLPEAIIIAGVNLLERNAPNSWCEVLYALKYVPLQDAFCYTLKRYDDYVNVINALNDGRLASRNTFLMMLFVHWFEWIVKVGTNLWSYEDKRHVYDEDKVAAKLKEEARRIRDEWFDELPDRIEQMIKLFAAHIQPEMMLEWSCKQPLHNDGLHNDYGEVHDQCLRRIWEVLSGLVDLKAMQPKQVNLNYLMLVGKTAMEQADLNLAKEVYSNTLTCLLKVNFSNLGAWSEIDEERQRIILELIKMLKPDLNAVDIINDITIKADGWNVDYQKVFEATRREAYIVCCLLRRFEAYEKDVEERLKDWKQVIDTFIRDYRRCDNEFIANDEFSVPLKVAAEIAEKHLDDQCRDYLHQVMLNEVLSIVSLLTIFSVCSLHLSGDTLSTLLNRIDVEWPSAQVLMDTRGRKDLRLRIESLIGQLRKAAE